MVQEHRVTRDHRKPLKQEPSDVGKSNDPGLHLMTELVSGPYSLVNGDTFNAHIAQFVFHETALIEAIQLWRDRDGGCYVSLVDRFRRDPFISGPYYKLSVRWPDAARSFTEVLLAYRGRSVDVFVCPMWYTAWGTPGWETAWCADE